jgi:ParB-like chromosome segregation protein Spo0J
VATKPAVELQFHPAANLFPIDSDGLDALAEDIRANGQHQPIELCDGKILDGRRRYMACRQAGIEPQRITVRPDDPIAYVLSLNLHRRHLDKSQRAMVAARARELYDQQAKERQREHAKTAPGKSKNTGGKSTTSEEGKSRDLAGRVVGVSGKSVDFATRVLK